MLPKPNIIKPMAVPKTYRLKVRLVSVILGDGDFNEFTLNRYHEDRSERNWNW
jgi:hypothetical protein